MAIYYKNLSSDYPIPGTFKRANGDYLVVTDASRPVDDDGWTIIEAAEDTRIVYVSSSEGDDDQTHPDEVGNVRPGAHKASEIGVTYPDDQSVGQYEANLRLNPIMTSSTEPEGVASSSSSGYGMVAWHAFNGTLGSLYYWDAGTDTGWLQYEFDSPAMITRYTITNRVNSSDVDRAPRDWTLEASNDGEDWSILHTVTDETQWERGEQRSFEFDNSQEYTHYRIDITQNNGGGRLHIHELDLKGPTTVEVNPVQTLSKAHDLIRDGYADWILLKRGDSWGERVIYKSGRSVEESMIYASYGDSSEPRPRIGRISNPTPNNNIGVFDLEFSGLTLLQGGAFENILFEGCLSKGQINVQRRPTNIELRRNVIVDVYPPTVGSQGVFGGAYNFLLEENILDHNGWWNPETNPGNYNEYDSEQSYTEGDIIYYGQDLYKAQEDDPQGPPEVDGETQSGWSRPGNPTIFNHNVYISTNAPPVHLHRNIFTRASSHGSQMGGGGFALENIYSHNPIHIIGARGSQPQKEANPFEFKGNVLLSPESHIDRHREALPRGLGLLTFNLDPENDNVIENNVFSNIPNRVCRLEDDSAGVTGVNNIQIAGNIFYDTGEGISFSGYSGPERNSDIAIASNTMKTKGNPLVDIGDFGEHITINSNKYYRSNGEGSFRVGGSSLSFSDWTEVTNDTDSTYEQVEFVDPDRSLATYNASLGGEESFEAFIYAAREQSRHNWNWEYHPVKILDYFNAGFSAVGEDPKDFEASYNIGPAERNHEPGGIGLGV